MIEPEKMTNKNLTNTQKFFIKRMLDNKSYGVYMRPGMGKTRTVLETLCTLKQQHNFFTTLVLCPPITMHNVWKEEIKKWGYSFSTAFIEGSEKYETVAGYDIYFASIDLFTYDKKNKIRNEKVKSLLARIRPEIIVIDESSKFKNLTSLRTMNLIHFLYRLEIVANRMRAAAKRYKRLYLLSGTPQPKNINNMFTQALLLDGGALLGTNIDTFEAYFTRRSMKDGVVKASKDIWHCLKPICATAENPHLANNIKYNTLYVDLGAHVLELYRTLSKTSLNSYVWFFVQTITKDGVGGLHLIKRRITEKGLPQLLTSIASGALYCKPHDSEQDLRGFFTVSDEKVKVLENLIASLQNAPVMVACNYNHEIARIRTMLTDNKIPHACLTGETLPQDRRAVIEKWNAKGVPVLLCNPASMGHGLNLQQGGSTIIWFSAPRLGDYELYEQFNARLNRAGQSEQVIVHHLVCKNTFDEIAFKCLQKKKGAAKAFMDFLKIEED